MRAGVGVVDQPRDDVVGEAALLAHRQEEAAAHPVAEDGVEQREHPAVGMVAPQRRQPDDELRLRCLALADQRRAPRPAAPARARTPGSTPLPVPNAVAASSDGLGVVEVAGNGDDGVGGPVRRPPEVPDRGLGQGADARLVAADLAAQRPVAEHRGLEQDLRVLGRVVLVASGSPR